MSGEGRLKIVRIPKIWFVSGRTEDVVWLGAKRLGGSEAWIGEYVFLSYFHAFIQSTIAKSGGGD